MHVEFEFTQDDLIDASRRSLARSGAVRSWRLRGLFYTVAFSWGLVFLFFLLFQEPLKGALIGLIAAAVSGLLYPGSHRRTVEKRLRQLHREKFGSAGPYLCEVELTPIGVWVRQMNTQVTHEWESVERVEETPDSVDIITRAGGGVIVRDRAFSSAEERKNFIELARGFMSLARVGGSDQDPQLTKG